MQQFHRYLSRAIIVGLILFVYRNWLISPLSLGGDLDFTSYDHWYRYQNGPYVWDGAYNNGFGQYILYILPIYIYIFPLLQLFHFVDNVFLLQKIILLWPFLFGGAISSYYFSSKFLSNPIVKLVAVLLYLCNPYALMLVSGGQMGVALAYATIPFAFTVWHQTIFTIASNQKLAVCRICISAALIAVLLALDPRILYLFLVMLVGLYLVHTNRSFNPKLQFIQYSKLIAATVLVTTLIHAYWLLPTIFVKQVSLPSGFDQSESLKFFSFTRFDHAISWSHPNYPQNFFGKVNEYAPIACLIPVVAFAAVKLRSKNRLVIYFTLLSLVAAFMAKGTNEPFGFIYEWLFNSMPGMQLFRDSSKFLAIVALGYSFLISITVEALINFQKQRMLKVFGITVLLLVFAIAWSSTWLSQLSGTMSYRTLPETNLTLQQILDADKSFGRVLVVPTKDIYNYQTLNHPVASFQDLTRPPMCQPPFCVELPVYPSGHTFTRADRSRELEIQFATLKHPESEQILQSLAINYVLLLPDQDQRLHTYDYLPDPSLYAEYKYMVEQLPYLTPIHSQDNLILYKVKNPGNFFSSPLVAKYQFLSPTRYQFSWTGGSGTVNIAQTYNNNWQVVDQQKHVIAKARPTASGQLQFSIDAPAGEYEMIFQGQRFAEIGWIITQVSSVFIIIGIILIWLRSKQKSFLRS